MANSKLEKQLFQELYPPPLKYSHWKLRQDIEVVKIIDIGGFALLEGTYDKFLITVKEKSVDTFLLKNTFDVHLDCVSLFLIFEINGNVILASVWDPYELFDSIRLIELLPIERGNQVFKGEIVYNAEVDGLLILNHLQLLLQ